MRNTNVKLAYAVIALAAFCILAMAVAEEDSDATSPVTATIQSNNINYGTVTQSSVESPNSMTVTVQGNTLVFDTEPETTVTATPTSDEYSFLCWAVGMSVLRNDYAVNTDTTITAIFSKSDSYVYVMNYTGENGEVIESVDVFIEGEYTHVDSSNNKIWKFDKTTGIGPFNSFYAAVSLDGDNAGEIAFILDPYDLQKRIDGSAFDLDKYNIVWVIPTVYWNSNDAHLYLTNDPGLESLSRAYAHEVDTNGDSVPDMTYQYIGIGVYEASSASVNSTDILASQTGQSPLVSKTIVQFDSLAHETPGATKLWNFYHWTFTKMATYLVGMGKNTQQIWGMGNASSGSASTTGLGDSAGPYVTSSTDYSKVFIENTWGSVWDMVGDTVFDNRALYAGQNAGIYDDQYSSISMKIDTGISIATATSVSWIDATSKNAIGWDLPTSITAEDQSVTDDKVFSPISGEAPIRNLRVGGYFVGDNWAGIATAYASWRYDYSEYTGGSRLAYGFNHLNEVTVEQDVNGTTTPSMTKYGKGFEVTFKNVPDSGYRLKNVKVQDTNEQDVSEDVSLSWNYTSGSFIMPNYSVMLVPQYEPISVITFDMKGHGEQVPTQTIPDGDTVAEPSKPAEKNFFFKGWYSDSSMTSVWDFSTPVYDDMVLYALWEVQTHQPTGVTLTFETVGGGSVSPSKITVPLGSVITIDGDKLKVSNGPSAEVVKAIPADGYAVQSWSLKEDIAVSDATVKVTFKKVDIVSISVYTKPFKVSYVPGEAFDPAGLIIELEYDDHSQQILQYRGNESSFTFTPSLDEPLKMTDKFVTITYKDATVQQEISVQDPSPGFDWTIVLLAAIVIVVIIAILILTFSRKASGLSPNE